ncbi:hypothetical protein [Luteipulveratus halotolerans]|nr:hypothetical protein [Luteipulveratus halotolerans]
MSNADQQSHDVLTEIRDVLAQAPCQHCGQMPYNLQGQQLRSPAELAAVNEQERRQWLAYFVGLRADERIPSAPSPLEVETLRREAAKRGEGVAVAEGALREAQAANGSVGLLATRQTKDTAARHLAQAERQLDSARDKEAKATAKAETAAEKVTAAEKARDVHGSAAGTGKEAGKALEQRLRLLLEDYLGMPNAPRWFDDVRAVWDGEDDYMRVERCLSMLAYRRAFAIDDNLRALGEDKFSGPRGDVRKLAVKGYLFPRISGTTDLAWDALEQRLVKLLEKTTG